MSRHDVIDWSGLGADVSEADIITGQGSATAVPKGSDPWQEALKATLPVLASAYQQQQLTKLNIARINQGLPAMSAQDYSRQFQVPAAQVQVGPTQEAQQLLMWGGAAVLALLALRSLRPRRS